MTTIIRSAIADHEKEPIRFAIPVPDDTADGGERLERFEVERPIPVTPILDMAVVESETGVHDPERVIAQGRLLRGLLGETQWPRFVRAASEARYGYAQLGEVIAFLLSDGAGRPTEPSSGSDSSQTGSGSSSTDGSEPSGGDLPPPYPPTN